MTRAVEPTLRHPANPTTSDQMFGLIVPFGPPEPFGPSVHFGVH